MLQLMHHIQVTDKNRFLILLSPKTAKAARERKSVCETELVSIRVCVWLFINDCGWEAERRKKVSGGYRRTDMHLRFLPPPDALIESRPFCYINKRYTSSWKLNIRRESGVLVEVMYVSVGERQCQRGADEEVVIGMESLLCAPESHFSPRFYFTAMNTTASKALFLYAPIGSCCCWLFYISIGC